MIKQLLFIAVFAFLSAQNQGIWVTRFALKSQKTLDNLITFAKKNDLTDVFLQVRGRGDAYYLSSIEKNIKIKSDIPLIEVISKLHKNKVKVHAWINVFLLASSQKNIELEKNHILNKNPNWIDYKNDLESFSNRLETPDDLKSNRDLEGIYTLPIFNDVLDYYKSITTELIEKYKFDGIHFDYFRLAGKSYGFHPKMRRKFQEENNLYIEKYMDRVMNPEVKEKWSEFVTKKFTAFLRALTKVNTEIQWSVAVKPNPFEAKYTYGQDWKYWLENDLVDFVVPMNYSASNYRFGKNMNYYLDDRFKDKIWVGIATFNQKKSEILSKIKIVRAKNFNFTLFSFNDLNEKSIKTILR